MRIVPVTVSAAVKHVAEVHRRLPKVQGGMWAIGLRGDGPELLGVAIVGRPTARMLPQDGMDLQVTRSAVRGGTPNGCSMLYGRASRIAKEMGADNCFTYIEDDESGVSLKAAGWIEDLTFKSSGGEWSRPSRKREATVRPAKKRRFYAPWSARIKRAAPPTQEGQ